MNGFRSGAAALLDENGLRLATASLPEAKGLRLASLLEEKGLRLAAASLPVANGFMLDETLTWEEENWNSFRIIAMVSISLNDLDKNLDAAKSRLKSLNFKNLEQEKKVGLDTRYSLDLYWSRLSRPPGLNLT